MGTIQGKPFSGLLFQESERRIMLFGLNFSGKSSILHKLKTGETLSAYMPTLGFEVEILKYKNSSLTVWDTSGRQRYKFLPLWKPYFYGLSGLVFVVDSTDEDQIEEAKDYLNMVVDEIQENVSENVPVLVYGNKCEVPAAMSASEISNKLDLASLRQRNWQRNLHVQSSCALCGAGLHEGLDWLLKNVGIRM